MSVKPKFKPVVTRVKLNPEQAVLVCSCYSGSYIWTTIASTRLGSAPKSYCAAGGSRDPVTDEVCLSAGRPVPGHTAVLVSASS